MKQVLQNLKDGATEVADVPCPRAGRGQLLIRSTHTLVSAGTERMLVDFGKAGFIDKARQQPDKVRMVLDKIRTDGLMPTLDAVRNKLDQPLALGYCNVGVVAEVGAGVSGFAIGDRVASNGKHAEMVSVPVNLCAKVPDDVDDEQAAFTVLGAIALQGIRLVQPTLGEAVVVTGLGLIGLVTVQLLRAQGCRVLGLDFDPAKLELARRFGADVVDLQSGADPVLAAMEFSRGRGVDAVIVTASTKSSEPMHQAASMCRKRGRIVLVGVTGLELSRADFYEKELSFQVSCSYGPGRYDPRYEDQGQDYPVGFVRWTEQRNFEAVLDMLADRRLDVAPLVSHRFDIARAQQAYAVVGGSEPSLGIVLHYPDSAPGDLAARRARVVPLPQAQAPGRADAPRVSVIGAGNYAGAVLIPAFKASGARLAQIASAGGVSSVHAGRKFGFAQATTDTDALLADADIDIVVISTRHDTHASYVQRALDAGKHVFVEKPLALTRDELLHIEAAVRRAPPPTADGRLQPPLRAPGAEDGVAAAGRAGAEELRHDGQRRRDTCRSLDAGPRRRRRPDHRRRLPLHRSAALSGRRADRVVSGGGDGRAHARQRQRCAALCRRLDRHDPLPRQRQQGLPEGAARSLCCRPRAAAGQLPPSARLRLAGLQEDEPVAPGQGPGRLRAAFVQAVQQGGACPIPLAELLEVGRISIEVEESLT